MKEWGRILCINLKFQFVPYRDRLSADDIYKGEYMNQKTLTKLEFDKIISRLEEEAGSFRGRQLCRRLKPMTDLEKINT